MVPKHFTVFVFLCLLSAVVAARRSCTAGPRAQTKCDKGSPSACPSGTTCMVFSKRGRGDQSSESESSNSAGDKSSESESSSATGDQTVESESSSSTGDQTAENESGSSTGDQTAESESSSSTGDQTAKSESGSSTGDQTAESESGSSTGDATAESGLRSSTGDQSEESGSFYTLPKRRGRIQKPKKTPKQQYRICGLPQELDCPCDPSLSDPQSCEQGLTCQKVCKGRRRRCSFMCKELPAELQCKPSVWEMVLQQDFSGAFVGGNISQLITGVQSGDEIMVKIIQGQLGLQEVTYDQTSETVYGQSVANMFNKPGAMATNVFIAPRTTSTTGNTYWKSMYPGVAAAGETDFQTRIKQFYSNKDSNAMMAFWYTRNNSNLVSSNSNLLAAAKRGATVRALWNSVLRELETVTVNPDGSIGGQFPMTLKGTDEGKFSADTEFEFAMISTGNPGTFDFTRVTAYTNVVTSASSELLTDTTWFVDPCWRQVYSPGGAGSVESLVQDVLAGSPVKIQMGNTFYKVSKLEVAADGSSVTAQACFICSDTAVLTRCCFIVTTSGDVTYIRKPIGDSEQATVTSGTVDVAWFVSQQEWTLQYHNGITNIGSESNVNAAYAAGAAFRLGVSSDAQTEIVDAHFLSSSGTRRPLFYGYNENQLELGPTGEVFQVRTFLTISGQLRRLTYELDGKFVDESVEFVEMMWWSQ